MTRTIVLGLTIMAMFFASDRGVIAQENLIKNGGFEDGLEDWDSFGNLAVSSEQTMSGIGALETNDSTQSTNFVYQGLDLQYEKHTISMWVYPVSSDYKFGFELVRNWNYSTADFITRVRITDDEIEFTAVDADTVLVNNLATKAWNHIQFRVDSSSLTQELLVNGLLVATLTSSQFPQIEHIILGDLSSSRMFGHFYFDEVEVVETVALSVPDSEERRSAIELMPAYPNPAKNSTTIPINVLIEQAVRLEVVDILGRQVSILLDGRLSIGLHQVPWLTRDVSPGIYFARINSGAVSIPILVY